jgi:hypothetical protein
MKIRRALWSVALILLVLSSATIANAALTIFGTGFSLPESISQAPAGFGTYRGDIFIPDPGIANAGLGLIQYLPQTGGSATVFVTLPGGSENPLGGLFLPSTFGAYGGQFLAVGHDLPGAFVMAVASDGTVTPVTSIPAGGEFVTPVLAPAGFGSVAGQVLITTNVGGNGTVNALDQTGHLSAFASVPGAALFGAAIAPQGFGSVGGELLATDAASGKIFAIDSNGNASLFTTVTLGLNQPGLRQIAFAPAGFGSYGGDLFVSVSGSGAGGGTFGALVVVDANGNVIATLIVGTQLSAFDPRGLYFPDSQNLLISSSDPIYVGTPRDFQPTIPEPTTILLVGSGMMGLWFRRRRS